MNTLGLQRLVDSNQRVFGTGVPVYYVVDNFNVASQEITEIGLTYTPPVTGDIAAGTTSTLIDPPPQVSALSASYISAARDTGMALRLGSVRFTVSSTWVFAMQALKGFATPQQVFEDTTVEGLMYRNILYNIVKALANDGTGGILSFDVLCNAPDQ